ncbi:hypothetical protein KAS45_01010 [candidate division WOR-3 bacterium]|nr:hypothetical protein [candidate division WOR-3 bacterium]
MISNRNQRTIKNVAAGTKINRIAGIRPQDRKRYVLKSKRARLRDIGMVWDTSVSCLLRGGPRIYTGPL